MPSCHAQLLSCRDRSKKLQQNHLLRAITGDGLKDARDRALLAIGFAGALRRAELAALRHEDIRREARGLRLTIRAGKTDQEGRGETIAIPEGRRIRPIALLDAWLDRAGLTTGWVFPRPGRAAAQLDDRTIARVVQRRAAAAGYDPGAFGGHSLRAGFLTAVAANGASIFKMKEVSRHRSTDVLAGYVRSANCSMAMPARSPTSSISAATTSPPVSIEPQERVRSRCGPISAGLPPRPELRSCIALDQPTSSALGRQLDGAVK